jgi:hypothetical protein
LRKILDKDNERILSVDRNHTATFENEPRFFSVATRKFQT